MNEATAASAQVPDRATGIPVLPGLPVVGNLVPFLRDPMGLLLDGYRRLGPVFRIRVPGHRFTVLAGPEANVFAGRAGDLFASESFWRGFGQQSGVDSFLPSMDGPEHFRLRKVMQRSYSRGAILRRLPEVVAITRQVARQMAPAGATVPVVALVRRAVTEQIGVFLTNRAPGEYFDDVVTFVRTALNVTVLHRWPRLMLHRPRYLRAKRRALALGAEVLAAHREHPAPGGEPDLIDDLLAASAAGRPAMTDQDLIIAALGPFIAGLDTSANTCAFMLYALLTNPEALARVRADADRLFAAGEPTAAALKDLPALHGAAMETMRLHAIAPFLGRTARRPFTFAGHTIEAGEELLVATTLPHHLAEAFPRPETFDIDRFHPPRNEHQAPGVYLPFGFGPHTCLGGGFAEIQIAVTMATLLRERTFALDPPDYRLKVRMDPTPTAGPGLRVRVLDARA